MSSVVKCVVCMSIVEECVECVFCCRMSWCICTVEEWMSFIYVYSFECVRFKIETSTKMYIYVCLTTPEGGVVECVICMSTVVEWVVCMGTVVECVVSVRTLNL